MNTRGLVILLSLLICSPVFAWSEPESGRFEYRSTAQVLDVDPLVEVIQVPFTTQHCWNEQVQHQTRDDSLAGSLIGGVLGGVLGNQVGKGHGREIATVAGTLLGATVGNRFANQGGRHYTTEERRCATEEHWESREQVVGYKVKYLYQGQVHYTNMTEHPGDEISVQVSVTPVRY